MYRLAPEVGQWFIRQSILINAAVIGKRTPIPLGMDLLLTPGEYVLGCDIADSTVQPDVVVVLDVALYQAPRISLLSQSNGKIERWHKSLKGTSGRERHCRWTWFAGIVL